MGSSTGDIGYRVALDAHLLSDQAGYRSAGVHQYIAHLVRHLPHADESLRLTALVGKHTAIPDPLVEAHRSRWPTGRAPVRIVWEQLAQPIVLRRLRADVVHGPVFVGPLFSQCPSVITVHDLSFLRYPRQCRSGNRLYLKLMTRLSAQRARRVIAVSRFTAQETTALLGIPAERIQVIYHGVEPAFRRLPADQVDQFRRRRDLPARFALFLGTVEPRKNLVRLVEALAQLGNSAVPLILAGGRGWHCDELDARIEALGLKENVRFAGYVPQDELPLWYNAASVLVYPSLYEGFGLPVLEAQACGTPVLTSAASSLPEVAGDAALLVDPHDANALSSGLDRLLHDASLRQDLRERGIEHAQHFTWPDTASKTAQVYRQALRA